MRDAGAVILGKTNTHEFAFGITTNNPHYGPTRSSYDSSRTPGGSSGGSAAAAAAALCGGAIGTDTGGSVRIPAALCGVAGVKPTLGWVGRGGLRGKKFGVSRKYFFENIHPDTEQVIDDCIREIRRLGGSIEDVEVKNLDIATPTGFNIVLAECIYLMEGYLKTFDPEASIGKYLYQLGPDVNGVLGSQKGTTESRAVPGYVYAKSVREDRNKMITGFEDAMSS